MKTIARRISKLENRFAEQRDERGRTPAGLVRAMRERRRRRLAAEGRESEEYLIRAGVVLTCREVNGGREAYRAVEYSSAGYAPGFTGPPQYATNPSRD